MRMLFEILDFMGALLDRNGVVIWGLKREFFWSRELGGASALDTGRQRSQMEIFWMDLTHTLFYLSREPAPGSDRII